MSKGSLQGCLGDTIRNSHFFIKKHNYTIMKTKILLSTLFGLLLISCKDNSNTPNQHSDTQESELYYVYDYANHTAMVTHTPYDESLGMQDAGYSGNIIIPSHTTYYDEEYEVTSIGRLAFAMCEDMYSVKIPQNITSIGSLAFVGNSSLRTITIEKGNPIYDSRYNCNAIIETETSTLIYGCNGTIIPNDILIIGTESFESLTFESMPIPEGVKRIEHHTLWRLPNLRSIEIPNSVVFIGENVLSYCESLESVSLGKSIEQLDYDVLRNNPCLKEITCYAIEPPQCKASCFIGISEDAILYVPAQSVSKYAENNVWGNTFKEVRPIETN